jgi:glycosyltransferase involved in cell wall biosynthesis
MSNLTYQPASQFCLVVPCYNEEEVLPRFFEEVLPRLELHTEGSWRAIFVDDGSSDRTWSLVCEKHLQDNRVCGLRLSRNFGHQAALYAGACHAKGEFVGFMDSDLQDPPDVLIELLQAVRDGRCDVCFGIREKRDAPLLLRMSYKSFYRIINSVADHDWPRDAGDFCVVRGDVLNSILQLIAGMGWVSSIGRPLLPSEATAREIQVQSFPAYVPSDEIVCRV